MMRPVAEWRQPAARAEANLPSTLFFIEPVVEPGNGGRSGGAIMGWRVYGGGFGHGVGLSQTGAVGMAQKNHSHDEILAHYYPGVSLDHRHWTHGRRRRALD
jgi:peptidoglycan hydrolase-like amidase